MTQSSATGTAIEFGATELQANAAVYTRHSRLIDAASRYDTVDDAVKCLRETWKVLEAQVEEGLGFTPDSTLGFGSDNAAVIAESLLGRRNSVGETRKSFKKLGKDK